MLYCSNCEEDTPQIVEESGHERDSSNDSKTCTICNWRWSGWTGEYSEPYKDDNPDKGYNLLHLNTTPGLFIPDKTIEDKDRLPSYEDYMKAREDEVPPYHIWKSIHFREQRDHRSKSTLTAYLKTQLTNILKWAYQLLGI